MDIDELFHSVSEGNPGTLRCITDLRYFTAWLKMLRWLDQWQIRGELLWDLYADVYHHSTLEFGQQLKGHLACESMLLHENEKHRQIVLDRLRSRFYLPADDRAAAPEEP